MESSCLNLQSADECVLVLQAERYIDERHRHRYEVNPALVDRIEEAGLQFVGRDETGQRMEVVEIAQHPFFVAAQFHPEFKSRPNKPSPLFLVGSRRDGTAKTASTGARFSPSIKSECV